MNEQRTIMWWQEAEDLPVGSVVRDDEDVFIKVDDHDWKCAGRLGRFEPTDFVYPAKVLHHPDEEAE